ncbi:hypothetical protein ZTR_06114 [Talaromyces verruculosus]|nr:hypothetical protein ZTR_06114 [Talaromyces verruculosus]
MSEHRSVCGSDGGLQFLRSVNRTFEELREGKNQVDQKLGVLETQIKRQELRNNVLDARMEACESKLNLTLDQLGFRKSEIRSLQEALHANEDRMNTILGLRKSEIRSLQEALHANEERTNTIFEKVDKRLTDLESTSSSRQLLQSESSYQRFMELRLYELECEAFGATEEHIKRRRHEIVHGGCIRADIEAIEGSSITDMIRFLRIREGFENCYGITVSHFKEVFQGAPPEVLDTLDKRRNLKKIKFWQDGKNIQIRGQLVSIANEIIEKWETGSYDTLDDLYRQLTQQYDYHMRKA